MYNDIPENVKKNLENRGIDPSKLNSASANRLMSSLSKSDADKLNAILNDKKALNDILNSDKAKKIMKNLFGDK